MKTELVKTECLRKFQFLGVITDEKGMQETYVNKQVEETVL